MDAQQWREMVGRGSMEMMDLIDDDVAAAVEEYVLALDRAAGVLRPRFGSSRTFGLLSSLIATAAWEGGAGDDPS